MRPAPGPVRNTSEGGSQLRLEVDVAAPVERTWAAAMDWHRQREWMLATRVRPTVGGGHGVGGRIEATTGIGPLGRTTPRWRPPPSSTRRI